jgi:hypothetical protein
MQYNQVQIHLSQRVSLFQTIPTELLHLILLYSAEQFPDVLRFRAVCGECREVGNCSVFWLTCKLSFWRDEDDRIVTGKQIRVSRKIEIDLNEEAIVPKLRKLCPSYIYISIHRPTSLNPIADKNTELTAGRPREQALLVSQRFLNIFRLTNRVWSKQTKNADSYKWWQSSMASDIAAFKSLALSRILLLIAAIGLLWEFPNYSQRPISLTNQMGFLCLYFILFQYFFYAVARFATKVLRFLVRNLYLVDWDSHLYDDYTRIFPTVGAMVVVLGITGFVILLQVLFSSRSISFPFYSLSFPIWFITVSVSLLALKMLDIFRRNGKDDRFLCFVSISIHVFPLSLLLAGLYYDLPSFIGICDDSNISFPISTACCSNVDANISG